MVRRGRPAVHQHGAGGIGDFTVAPHDRDAYLCVGVLLRPHATGLLQLDIVTHASALERVPERAVIVSLFTAGLKLRVPVRDRQRLIAVRLAVISMALTVGLVATAIVAVFPFAERRGRLLTCVVGPTKHLAPREEECVARC